MARRQQRQQTKTPRPRWRLILIYGGGILIALYLFQSLTQTPTKNISYSRRPRTWLSVTPLGRQAYRAEIESLKLIVAEFERRQLG